MNNFKYIILLFICSNYFSLFGVQEIQSPFNSVFLKSENVKDYSFIVSGHFHGGGHNKTGYPTNTLLANLDWINNSKSEMIISLGDLFLDVSNDIPYYQQSFFSKLKKPLFNAVGNHDLTGNIYQEHFGKTFYYFTVGSDIHLILDTEAHDGSIKGEQLKLLNEIEKIIESTHIANLFIYSHRTVWAKSYRELDRLFQDNTQSSFGNNFESDVLPILERIQQKTQTFWFSGSIGNAPASFFQYKCKNGIQYVATAIRGMKRDAALIVNVNDNVVSFETKSFTRETLLGFESYNVKYWVDNVGVEAFNYRLIPLYIKQIIFDSHFWYGILVVLFSISIFYFYRRKKFTL
jgi:hypothetical protein